MCLIGHMFRETHSNDPPTMRHYEGLNSEPAEKAVKGTSDHMISHSAFRPRTKTHCKNAIENTAPYPDNIQNE